MGTNACACEKIKESEIALTLILSENEEKWEKKPSERGGRSD